MARTLWKAQTRNGSTVRLLVGEEGLSGFTDVEVVEPGGAKWLGTVAPLEAVASTMDSYRDSGECLSGSYLWTAHLLILRSDDEQLVFDSIFDLVESGEVATCFEPASE